MAVALVATFCSLVSATAAAAAQTIAPSATIEGRSVHSGEGAPSTGALALPLRTANPAVFAREKRQAEERGANAPLSALGVAEATPGSAAPFGPAAAVFGSLNSAGLSAAQEITAFGAAGTPPDSTGAIGPEDYVESVNEEVAAYKRSNLALAGSPVALSTFTGGVSPCDPQIKYDPKSSRWFYSAIRCDHTTKLNTLYLGFSKTSDPTDLSTATGHGWCGYAYSTGTTIEDYDKLGLDSSHIMLGSNNFTIQPEAFNTAHILSLPKPASGKIETCPSAPKLTTFGSKSVPLRTSVESHLAFTPQPATVADESSSGYIVSADESEAGSGKGSHVMIWQLAGTGESPQLKAVGAPAVAEFKLPPNVPQPGSSDGIDPLDGRLTQAVAAADPGAGGAEAVWTQHTVAGGAGSVVSWYELLPGKLEVRQAGTISDPSRFVFNGAIAPTLSGGAAINYNTGSSSELVQIMAQSRVGADPLGTMNTPISLASSAAIDSDFSCPSVEPKSPVCRWGDYAGASVDPLNANLVWGSNQLNGPAASGHNSQWATQNFALTPTSSPAVETCAPIVTQTTANLCGDVNPNGAEVSQCTFEYGATTSYGKSVPCTPSPGSGTSPVEVHAEVVGLSPNATYHFRISATNARGTGTSSDRGFKTLPNPPTVVTEAASAPGLTTATLNASVNPNGGEASGCTFEYGATPAYGSSVPCTPAPGSGTSPVAVSAAIGGLAERSTYHFRVSATNAGGTSSGADQTLRTLPAPHYYLNSTSEGAALPAGMKVQVLSWGALTVTPEAPSKATPTSCETGAGGFVENPEGLAGGAGRGATQSEAEWNCASASCPAGLVEFPAGSGKSVEQEAIVIAGGEASGEGVLGGSLPWADELYEPKLGKIRSESKGVVLELACVARKSVEGSPPLGDGDGDSPQLLMPATVCSTTPTNLQAPLFERGTQVGGPLTSKLNFDAESGKLSCVGPGEKAGEQIAFTATSSGRLHMFTFEGQEVLLAK